MNILEWSNKLLNPCSVLTGQHQVGSAANENSRSNNYSRPEGQNVGNFLTDKNTSRVLAPPGGKTSFSFGGEETVSPAKSAKVRQNLFGPLLRFAHLKYICLVPAVHTTAIL